MTRTKTTSVGKGARAPIGQSDAEADSLPPALAERWVWQLHAACRGTDGAWFFPPDREFARARARRVARAKAVCAGCPALLQCREFAATTRQSFGVWGGLSEEDREKAAQQESTR